MLYHLKPDDKTKSGQNNGSGLNNDDMINLCRLEIIY